MARLTRLNIPGQMHLVQQKASMSQGWKWTDEDSDVLAALLQDHCSRYQVLLHGYGVTQEAFTLLVTPQAERSLPQAMQAIARDFVRHINRNAGRSGTIWEGRYRSAVLDTVWVLDALALLSKSVAADEGSSTINKSSSYYAYAGHEPLPAYLSIPAAYWGLANTPFEREARFRAHVEALKTENLRLLEDSIRGGWALGERAFIASLQGMTERRLQPKSPGRPAKNPVTTVPI